MNKWALTICVSCILSGALELFLPKNEYAKSIKSVLALYILVSVLSPFSNISHSEFNFLSLAKNNVPVIDYSEYRAELECESIEESLATQLHAQNADSDLNVDLGPPLTITVVTAYPEKVNQILMKALEHCEPYVVNIEDIANES